MQMVGATKTFIRRPFIWHNIRLGVLGALMATGSNSVLLFYLSTSLPDLKLTQHPKILGGLFLVVLVIGVFMTWISTHMATQRFLNLKTDQLYK